MRVLGLESGPSSARGTMFRAFWRLRRVWAKVGLSLRGELRAESNIARWAGLTPGTRRRARPRRSPWRGRVTTRTGSLNACHQAASHGGTAATRGSSTSSQCSASGTLGRTKSGPTRVHAVSARASKTTVRAPRTAPHARGGISRVRRLGLPPQRPPHAPVRRRIVRHLRSL